LNPVVIAGRPQSKDKPPLLILLDTSRSMATPDGEKGLSRFEEAKRNTVNNRQLIAELSRKSSVRIFEFAEGISAASLESAAGLKSPNGERTDIGKAIIGAAGGRGK